MCRHRLRFHDHPSTIMLVSSGMGQKAMTAPTESALEDLSRVLTALTEASSASSHSLQTTSWQPRCCVPTQTQTPGRATSNKVLPSHHCHFHAVLDNTTTAMSDASTPVATGDALGAGNVAKEECDQNSSKLWDNERFSDVIIRFSGRKIFAHRFLLCPSSPYFEKLCGPQSPFVVRPTQAKSQCSFTADDYMTGVETKRD